MRARVSEAAPVGATFGMVLSLTVAASSHPSVLLYAGMCCCLLGDMAADDDELHSGLCEGLQGWCAAADYSRWRYGQQPVHTRVTSHASSPALSLHVSTHTDQRGSAQLCPKRSSSKHLLPP